MGHAGFRYEACPALFGCLEGDGPLVLAFDTDIVIDLTQRFEAAVGDLGVTGLEPELWWDPDCALRDLFSVVLARRSRPYFPAGAR